MGIAFVYIAASKKNLSAPELNSLVYQARPISLTYWKLELCHREKHFTLHTFQ